MNHELSPHEVRLKPHSRAGTLGALKASGWKSRPVKQELRENLIDKLRRGESVFPGLIGYDRTVVPQVQKAILSGHDFILLGLRGQAKTRLLRALPALLDDAVPVVAGCELNDDPLAPICAACRRRHAEMGDDLPVAWWPREERYREKLATPDVTVADLIGDIDPIKAATRKLSFADPEVIHYGIIPRTNRGIFAINELPDLQARIQVGLLNILEEGDVQIRGFPVRLPLDLALVFSANPEDYTNRGSIITPLRDRISSQILTHYPRTLAEGRAITAQEAWVDRSVPQGAGGEARGAAGGVAGSGDAGDARDTVVVTVPEWLKDAVEDVAFAARANEFVDQNSGVSARVTIALMENLVSGAERRAILAHESHAVARVADLVAATPAITGKIELVYEGEREGPAAVALHLVGHALKTVFARHFPDALAVTGRSDARPRGGAPGDSAAGGSSERGGRAGAERGSGGKGGSAKGRGPDGPAPSGSLDAPEEDSAYKPILRWFRKGGTLDLSDELPAREFFALLDAVPGLRDVADRHLPSKTDEELAAVMELVLEGLYLNSLVAKDELIGGRIYKDVFDDMAKSLRD